MSNLIKKKGLLKGSLTTLLAALLAFSVLASPALAAGDPLPAAITGEQAANSADAQGSEGGGNVGFAVKALLPENQVDSRQSYFSLRMEPSAQQDLQVEVANSSDGEIEVRVSAISASTASNGLIDYRTPDRHDSSLKTPFSAIATVQEPVMRLSAGETKTAVISLRMPAESYDGVILGGLVFTKTPESEMEGNEALGEDQTGTMITNVYSYVIGVVLNETDVEVLPDFELVNVAAELVNYSASCVHYIRNKNAAIAKGIAISIEVRRAGSDEVIHRYNREGLEMAPNSLMELNTGWDPGAFEAGDYTSAIHMEQGGKSWDFSMDFAIEEQEAIRINEENLDKPIESNNRSWLIILVVVVLLLLALLLLFLFLKKRKDDGDDAPKGGGHRRRRSGSSNDDRFY